MASPGISLVSRRALWSNFVGGAFLVVSGDLAAQVVEHQKDRAAEIGIVCPLDDRRSIPRTVKFFLEHQWDAKDWGTFVIPRDRLCTTIAWGGVSGVFWTYFYGYIEGRIRSISYASLANKATLTALVASPYFSIGFVCFMTVFRRIFGEGLNLYDLQTDLYEIRNELKAKLKGDWSETLTHGMMLYGSLNFLNWLMVSEQYRVPFALLAYGASCSYFSLAYVSCGSACPYSFATDQDRFTM
uniref:Uncharacterized protein n=1 Tax=Chromera velia CCMP2878 TaxID=1169474 RepID=A0A0G4IEN6_9ALVE|eukprot:Cvel_13701.t1-p1 / transcript=Cvel_13701.t1 / gene=Cvel_13701 / organism=Chromera_velia_CCMP2878 / gene_product=hypothetical protein / transcript_product=hypothetical protein / location=Cvel_scaffold947:467-1892(-) / protein_length=241 / sequence_SO=supercontig / SO=protein_coding / is_pseudo=false